MVSALPESWVFDVDGCLVDSLTGSSLRPGARALLTDLTRQNRIFLWSAGGDEYARSRALQFGLGDLVDDYFAKEGRDRDGRYLTTHLPLGTGRAVFVDDRPEDLAEGLEVIAVSPYLVDDRFDHGLDVIVTAVSARPEPARPARHRVASDEPTDTRCS
jgi:long-chain acyl-CoA synthetase